MKEQLEKIYANAAADIEKSASINDLDNIRAKYLSRKGEFNEIKKNLKKLWHFCYGCGKIGVWKFW